MPLERLPETLAEIARRHRAMLERLAVLDPEDPRIRELIERARAAIEASDYELADRLLSQAEDLDLAAVRQADELLRQARQAADERRLSATSTRAERGALAETQLEYLTAAAHYRTASELVPADNFQERGRYLLSSADALRRHGDERGDNAVLDQAIARYRQVLTVLTRERVPLDWATTQTNLGGALTRLGEREAGTARLEQAVAALRAALEERTRERVPLHWAQTQNNLGATLQRLGEREQDLARLLEARTVYRHLHEYYRVTDDFLARSRVESHLDAIEARIHTVTLNE